MAGAIEFDTEQFAQFQENAKAFLPEVVVRTDAGWPETVGTVLEDYLCSAWSKVPLTRGAKHAYVRASIESYGARVGTLIRAAARCLQIRLDPILNVTLEDIVDRMEVVFRDWEQGDFRSKLNPWAEDGNIPRAHKYAIGPNTDKLRDWVQIHRGEMRVEVKSAKGQFPIVRAVYAGQIANVEVLVELDPEQLHLRFGPKKATLLHLAVERRNIYMAHALIWLGIKVDARDADYATPLEYAVTSKQYDMVELLVREGRRAIFNRNRDGRSLLHLDTSPEIIELLVSAGVDPCYVIPAFEDFETPLTSMIARENAVAVIPAFIYACERMGYRAADIINACECISRAAGRHKWDVMEILIALGGEPTRPIAETVFMYYIIPPEFSEAIQSTLIVSKAAGERWDPDVLLMPYVERFGFDWSCEFLVMMGKWDGDPEMHDAILACRRRMYFRQSLLVSLLRALGVY